MRVEIDQLYKGFWLQSVLQGVDLQVEPGQILALVGVNGSGKTTILRCLATLLIPDRGEIRFDGEVLNRSRLDLRRRLHLVPDTPPRAGNIDLTTQIAFILRAYGEVRSGIADQIAELLIEFGIEDCRDQLLPTLSRGQAYKAALVTLIALDCELWLLDEPFGSGMDPRGLAAFRRHARMAASRGRTIIYTTQLLEVVERFADRIGLLSKGRLTVHESMEAMKASGDDDGGWLAEYTDPLPGDG
jgi:ABC-2 type transport system ATP-binding protein